MFRYQNLFISFTFLFASTSIPFAQDKIETQSVLAIAKITGACGIMDEMIAFQKKTQMLGGDEFVIRFLQTESARRGLAIQEMFDQCKHTIATYNQFWKLAEPQK